MKFAKLYYEPEKWQHSAHDLRQLPDGSVGREMIRRLDKAGFTLHPGYELHDVKHTLLDYSFSPEDEVCMQVWFMGNRNYSLPVLGTVAYGIVSMPDQWKRFAQHFVRGWEAPDISHWDFNALVTHDLEAMRARIAEGKGFSYRNRFIQSFVALVKIWIPERVRNS